MPSMMKTETRCLPRSIKVYQATAQYLRALIRKGKGWPPVSELGVCLGRTEAWFAAGFDGTSSSFDGVIGTLNNPGFSPNVRDESLKSRADTRLLLRESTYRFSTCS